VKLIIAGSRDIYPTVDYIAKCIKHPDKITRIVSGGARGVDTAAIAYAKKVGLPCVVFYPGYGLHGPKVAPFVRNNDMAFFSDGLLAIWDGQSRGTAHMINAMRELGKPVRSVRY
jgi:hypothetical protein